MMLMRPFSRNQCAGRDRPRSGHRVRPRLDRQLERAQRHRGPDSRYPRHRRAAKRWLGATVALGFAAAVPAAAEQSGHRVFRADETIRFERKCADATPHQVQAFAELESEDTRARALVLVYAQHDAVRRDDIFIGIRLIALRIDTGGCFAATSRGVPEPRTRRNCAAS